MKTQPAYIPALNRASRPLSSPRPLLLASLVVVLTMLCGPGRAGTSSVPRETLAPFASDQAFAEFYERWADEARKRRPPPVERPTAPVATSIAASPVAPGGAAPSPEPTSVTNVQHAGVDEGASSSCTASIS